MVRVDNLRKCSDVNGVKRQKCKHAAPQPGKENEMVRVLKPLLFCTSENFPTMRQGLSQLEKNTNSRISGDRQRTEIP
jgi:hypothetical protein